MRVEPERITGFILAGGQSRRMGSDKAQIRWDSGTLLSHAVEVMSTVVSEVFILGSPQAGSSPVIAIPDEFPGRGPLAGIHAALKHSSTKWNLVLAVDLPLVPPGLLGFIAAKSNESPTLAIVPRIDGRLQPLCAAYNRNFLPEIEHAVVNNDLSIHRLLERHGTGIMEKNKDVEIIEEDEIIAQGFQPEMLTNVNTPEDLERVRAIASTLHVK
jgi:molybdopterin-guanine dinucleotide biosynthesis protein A